MTTAAPIPDPEDALALLKSGLHDTAQALKVLSKQSASGLILGESAEESVTADELTELTRLVKAANRLRLKLRSNRMPP